MANLITNHDPFHVHKLFGLMCLLNYLLRIYYLLSYGTAFPSHEPEIQAICSVIMHGALSMSSLLLPLPAKRNFSSPMIWPEFRLHSITFAMRHVIATSATLYNLWPNQSFLDASFKVGLIFGTIQIASWITDQYGDREKRTTNSMPYPRWISQDMQNGVKNLYARAQFGATKTILFGDPTLSYFPLFGIQMAPLLMTLVRKGKITSITYHRVYAFSLFVSYVALFIRLCMQPDELMVISLIFSGLFPLSSLRKSGISSYMVWIFYTGFYFGLVPRLEENYGMCSVLLVCSLTIICTGIKESDRSLKSRLFWSLFVVAVLTINQVCLKQANGFEEMYLKPSVYKFIPLMIMQPIWRQVIGYGCLFYDKSKSTVLSVNIDVQASNVTEANNDIVRKDVS